MKNMNKPNGSGTSTWLMTLLICVIAMWILSCNGDGGSGMNYAGGGIGGSGYSSGSVSRFGSIYSNGIHFDTTDAEIFIEGQSVGSGDTIAQEHLDIGQIVRIDGDIHEDLNGTALRIYYDKTMEGPVESVASIDPFTRKITILKQEIIVGSQTEFINADLDSLMTNPGQVLEISGLFNDEGILLSKYIAKKQGMNRVTVTGLVQELNTNSQTFQMGTLVIDYSQATSPIPTFANGEMVRVKGTTDAGGVLLADELSAWDALDFVENAEDVRIEGIIQQVDDHDSPQQIVADDVPVWLDEHTIIGGNQSNPSLFTSMEVVVSGTLTDGILYADEINFRNEFVYVEGTVATLNETDQTFTLDDQLIRVNDYTEIWGGHYDLLTFEDISEGDNVFIWGWLRTDNSITAEIIFSWDGSEMIGADMPDF